MTEPIANERFPYFGEEHGMLRSTLRRFIADKVLPHGDQWEEQGFVPREVLRELGSIDMLLIPDTLAAARHAATKGFVAPTSIQEVAIAVNADLPSNPLEAFIDEATS
jgi:alkylation response protein AidB-like acyl-CoA dehydrogenase